MVHLRIHIIFNYLARTIEKDHISDSMSLEVKLEYLIINMLKAMLYINGGLIGYRML